MTTHSIHRFAASTAIAALACVLSAPSFAASLPGAVSKAPSVPGQVAVYATPEQLSGETVVKFLPHAGITVVATKPGNEGKKVREFHRQGLRAGVNRLFEASEIPDDPLYSPHQWHLTRINAETAWEVTTGAGALVAVLDSGLASNGAVDGVGCASGDKYDVVNQDDDPDDGDGHGTHVSGTIAQTTNNAVGTAGMAHGACILAVKVLDDSGSGTTADIADGIHYAVDKQADVINMSLGISARFKITNDPVMDPALDYAYANGTTVVCAAGNESSTSNVGYPAIYPTTIAVGATDYADGLARYSNAGQGLDIVAPGGDTSTDLNSDGYPDGVLQETRIDGTWDYYFFQGTSMASPHVAAVAALLIAQGVASTPADVLAALTQTALDLGDSGYDQVYGHGLVQADGALDWEGEAPVCTDADGDGVCVEDGDCNDTDGTVYPGAPDSRKRSDRNGIDNDCDGLIDR